MPLGGEALHQLAGYWTACGGSTAPYRELGFGRYVLQDVAQTVSQEVGLRVGGHAEESPIDQGTNRKNGSSG